MYNIITKNILFKYYYYLESCYYVYQNKLLLFDMEVLLIHKISNSTIEETHINLRRGI